MYKVRKRQSIKKFPRKFFFILISFKGVPLSSTPPSVQHISSTQKGQSFSAPEIPQFHTKNSSVQHNPLSSTPETPQFNTSPSVPHQKTLSSTHPLSSTPKNPLFGVELRGFWCGTEGCVELRGFWCWTERFLVWNWGISGAEKEWPFCVQLMCLT